MFTVFTEIDVFRKQENDHILKNKPKIQNLRILSFLLKSSRKFNGLLLFLFLAYSSRYANFSMSSSLTVHWSSGMSHLFVPDISILKHEFQLQIQIVLLLPLPLNTNSPTAALAVPFCEAMQPPFSALNKVILCTVYYFRYLHILGLKSCN